MTTPETPDGLLTAPYVLEWAYRRSTGPVLGQFFGALTQRRVLGARLADGRVIVPPKEYDPWTGADVSELVPVSSSGVVTTWAWVSDPRPKHPLQRPFAWALVQLDGADTAMLHAVDARDSGAMHTGLRVRIRWAEERTGTIKDIACFEPDPGAAE